MRDTNTILAELDNIPTLPEIEKRIEKAIEAGHISPCTCAECRGAAVVEIYGQPLWDEELSVFQI